MGEAAVTNLSPCSMAVESSAARLRPNYARRLAGTLVSALVLPLLSSGPWSHALGGWANLAPLAMARRGILGRAPANTMTTGSNMGVPDFAVPINPGSIMP